MGSFLQAITASATAFVVSGNSGVSPMLTMFAVGVIENVNPDLLNMNDAIDALLASPWSLVFTGALTVAELVAKCVPVLDELIDAAMTFVIPVVSIIGTLSTFGLWDVPSSQEMDEESEEGEDQDANEAGGDQDGNDQDEENEEGEDQDADEAGEDQDDQDEENEEGEDQDANEAGEAEDEDEAVDDEDEVDQENEEGQDQDGNDQRRRLSVASGVLWIFKIFLLIAGVGLALSMHAVKMLIRLVGEGWATGCLAVSEVLWVSFTIILALLIRPIAVVLGSFIVMVSVFNGARILRKRLEEGNGKHAATDYHQGPEVAMQNTNRTTKQKTNASKLQQEGFKFTEKVRSKNYEESGNTSGMEYHRAIEEKPSKLRQSGFKFTELA